MFDGSRPLSPSEPPPVPGYIAAVWPPQTPDPSAIATLKCALAEHAPQLRLQLAKPGLAIFSQTNARAVRASIDATGNLVIIGAAFDRALLESSPATPADPDRLALLDDAALFRAVWGSYIAIRRVAGVAGVTLLRDPGGGLPAFVAQAEGLQLIAPALPDWLRKAAGITLRIDRALLSAALADPLLPTHCALLTGLHQVAAGSACRCDGISVGAIRQLWPDQPTLAAPHAARAPRAEGLRRAVTGCVRALAASHDSVTLELSGGLDSAIVLGALASAAVPVDVSCVNFAVAHAGGDERPEARAVADRWQARLVEVTAKADELRFEEIFSGEQPVEPILYGLDPVLERASIGVATAFDSTAIFTGQGGDAVFANLPTALVAVDYARAVGWRAHFSQIAYDAARRAHRSLWHVEGLMLRDLLWRRHPVLAGLPGQHLGKAALADAPRARRHPWLAGDQHLAPARRIQFEAIANCQHFNSPTWRSRVAALVHPLLAQPVVEACLAIPTYQLAAGPGDRALAREVFRDWLPPVVQARRDKGDATNYYRRAVAENRLWLRDFLLQGVLVAEGLLDGAGIDAALREENLIWSDSSRLIVVYASFEAWARYWGNDGVLGESSARKAKTRVQ